MVGIIPIVAVVPTGEGELAFLELLYSVGMIDEVVEITGKVMTEWCEFFYFQPGRGPARGGEVMLTGKASEVMLSSRVTTVMEWLMYVVMTGSEGLVDR